MIAIIKRSYEPICFVYRVDRMAQKRVNVMIRDGLWLVKWVFVSNLQTGQNPNKNLYTGRYTDI